MTGRPLFILLLAMLSLSLAGQEKSFTTGGFVRGGIYFSTGDYQNDINAAFGDAALTLTATDNLSFKGIGDLRMRWGQQFGDNISSFMLQEAWGMYYNSFMSISAGKKIIRWGKTDIYTPLSRFNPVDYTFRSPDFEDAETGNLLGEITFTPAPFFRLSVVAAPFWNPSVLLIKPITLPPSMQVALPEGLRTGNGYHSWGVRGDFTFSVSDAGLQYYHGPDLMPGLSLVNADYTNPLQPAISVEGVPYIITSAGFDFETTVSPFVLRGAAAITCPEEEKEGNEEVPFRQYEWVAAIDWTPGAIRVTAEYSGKKVLDFYEAPYDPLIGTEPDMQQLAELFNTPGFDPVEFTRLQIEAFNRLYNNQMHEFYHSAGIRMEADLFYGRLIPSFTAAWNFTSKDLTVRPALKFKPSDGVTLSAGYEHYHGTKGGLYDIIDDFMKAAYFSLRIDF
ncbi:MAG: hypothetical protein MUE37_13810 [Bacteroidales bacterium]|jgi:hypothetical protein|nr:hypothetical protein [Bacteroidales bacterium]